jgi:hypothetical protein
MPAYRLDRVAGTERDPEWSRTTLSEPCWVNASSEDQARDRVCRATGIASSGPKIIGSLLPTCPWNNAALTTCVVDPEAHVDEGIVMSRSGVAYPY